MFEISRKTTPNEQNIAIAGPTLTRASDLDELSSITVPELKKLQVASCPIPPFNPGEFEEAITGIRTELRKPIPFTGSSSQTAEVVGKRIEAAGIEDIYLQEHIKECVQESIDAMVKIVGHTNLQITPRMGNFTNMQPWHRDFLTGRDAEKPVRGIINFHGATTKFIFNEGVSEADFEFYCKRHGSPDAPEVRTPEIRKWINAVNPNFVTDQALAGSLPAQSFSIFTMGDDGLIHRSSSSYDNLIDSDDSTTETLTNKASEISRNKPLDPRFVVTITPVNSN